MDLNQLLQGGGIIQPGGQGGSFLDDLTAVLGQREASARQARATGAAGLAQGVAQGQAIKQQKVQNKQNQQALDQRQQAMDLKAEEERRKQQAQAAKAAFYRGMMQDVAGRDATRQAVTAMEKFFPVRPGEQIQMPDLDADELSMYTRGTQMLTGPEGRAWMEMDPEGFMQAFEEVNKGRRDAVDRMLERAQKQEEYEAKLRAAGHLQDIEGAPTPEQREAELEQLRQDEALQRNLELRKQTIAAAEERMKQGAVGTRRDFLTYLGNSGDPMQVSVGYRLTQDPAMQSKYASPPRRKQLLDAMNSLQDMPRVWSRLLSGATSQVVDSIYGSKVNLYKPFGDKEGLTSAWVDFGRQMLNGTGKATINIGGQELEVVVPEGEKLAVLGVKEDGTYADPEGADKQVASWRAYIQNYLAEELFPSRAGKMTFGEDGFDVSYGATEGVGEDQLKQIRDLMSKAEVVFTPREGGSKKIVSLGDFIANRKEYMPGAYEKRTERANTGQLKGTVWEGLSVNEAQELINDISASVRAGGVHDSLTVPILQEELNNMGATESEIQDAIDVILPAVRESFDDLRDSRVAPHLSSLSHDELLARWPEILKSNLSSLEQFRTVTSQIRERKSEQERKASMTGREKAVDELKSQFKSDSEQAKELLNQSATGLNSLNSNPVDRILQSAPPGPPQGQTPQQAQGLAAQFFGQEGAQTPGDVMAGQDILRQVNEANMQGANAGVQAMLPFLLGLPQGEASPARQVSPEMQAVIDRAQAKIQKKDRASADQYKSARQRGEELRIQLQSTVDERRARKRKGETKARNPYQMEDLTEKLALTPAERKAEAIRQAREKLKAKPEESPAKKKAAAVQAELQDIVETRGPGARQKPKKKERDWKAIERVLGRGQAEALRKALGYSETLENLQKEVSEMEKSTKVDKKAIKEAMGALDDMMGGVLLDAGDMRLKQLEEHARGRR